jgi:hypothetical protein
MFEIKNHENWLIIIIILTIIVITSINILSFVVHVVT